MSRYPASPATLEPVRFGEFLRDRHLITDEQWLAALAQHWSEPLRGRRQMIGATIVENGFLSAEVVEREARIFHDDLDVVEIADTDDMGRAEKVTVPIPPAPPRLGARSNDGRAADTFGGRTAPDRC